jgi:hypothetical protein
VFSVQGVDVTNSSDKYSVAHVAAGYLYQARLALSEALKYANIDSSVEVSIEKLDDVAFEKDGGAVDLLQTKHPRAWMSANATGASTCASDAGGRRRRSVPGAR